MKKFVRFGLLALQLSRSFIYKGLQIVGVFFHHGKHVVYYRDGSEMSEKKEDINEKKKKND